MMFGGGIRPTSLLFMQFPCVARVWPCCVCGLAVSGAALAATVTHVHRLSGVFADDVAAGERVVASWIGDPAVANVPRTPQPISHLKIALQCGGSDAFSGISGECCCVTAMLTPPLQIELQRRRGGVGVCVSTYLCVQVFVCVLLWNRAANPLIGYVARELIRHGGAALLAETPELIGAESYILRHVKDVETADGWCDGEQRGGGGGGSWMVGFTGEACA